MLRYSVWHLDPDSTGSWVFRSGWVLTTNFGGLPVLETYRKDAALYNAQEPFVLLAYPDGGTGLRVDDDGFLHMTCPRCGEEVAAHEWLVTMDRLIELLRAEHMIMFCPCCHDVCRGEEFWSDLRMFNDNGGNGPGVLRRKVKFSLFVNGCGRGEYIGHKALMNDGTILRILDAPVLVTRQIGLAVGAVDIGGMAVGAPSIKSVRAGFEQHRTIELEGWWPVEEGVRRSVQAPTGTVYHEL